MISSINFGKRMAY